MARPREFDETQALTSALDVFRAKGYEAASLIDLLKAMGLSKSSLYNSFGTKHDLFIASIDHYVAHYVRDIEDKLGAATSLRSGLNEAFGVILDMSVSREDRRGCYLCVCASEVLPHDEVAEKHISNGLDRLQNAFTSFIQRAQQRGDVPADKDASQLGEFLLMSLMGMQFLGRATADRNRMDSLLTELEKMLT